MNCTKFFFFFSKLDFLPNQIYHIQTFNRDRRKVPVFKETCTHTGEEKKIHNLIYIFFPMCELRESVFYEFYQQNLRFGKRMIENCNFYKPECLSFLLLNFQEYLLSTGLCSDLRALNFTH